MRKNAAAAPGRSTQRVGALVLKPVSRRMQVWTCLGLLLLCVIVFARVLGHPWLGYDDKFHVVDNPFLQAGTWGEMMAGIGRLWGEPYGNLYIPVSYTVMGVLAMLTRGISGVSDPAALSPVGFHVVQIALHAMSGALVFGVLRRVGAVWWGAALGAAVFLVHPLQAESVAWLSEMRGVLAGFLGLMGLWLHLRSCGRADEAQASDSARSSMGSWMMYGLGVVCFGLALLAKPSVVGLPLAALALDVYRRVGFSRAVLRALPWMVLGAVLVVITQRLQSGGAVYHAAPVWARPLIAGDSMVFYLWKLLWPMELTPDYGRTPTSVLLIAGGWWARCVWIVPMVIAIGAAWWGAVKKRPMGRVVLAAGAVALAGVGPVLGLVTFDHQNISTVADRYVYLAMLGPSMLLAMAVSMVAVSAWRRVCVVGATVVLALLATRTVEQLDVWRNDRVLWRHSVSVSPRGATGWNNYGDVFVRAGDHGRAIEAFRRAIEIDPLLGIANANLGWSLLELGREDEAEPALKRGLELASDRARAQAGWGMLMGRRGKDSAAVAAFAKAAEIEPRSAENRANLGVARMHVREFEAAERELREAIALKPEMASAHFNLGVLLQRTERTGEAMTALQRATVLDAELLPAWLGLGDAALKMGRLDEARRAFARALEISPKSEGASRGLSAVRETEGKGLGP